MNYKGCEKVKVAEPNAERRVPELIPVLGSQLSQV